MYFNIHTLCVAAALIHTSAATAIENSPNIMSAEIILDDMNHAISTTRSVFMSRASPQCWMNSISQWPSTSGATFCASMTEEQQKLLALELTNCQLMEESRPLFRQETDSLEVSQHATSSCHVGKGGSEPFEVSSCLPFMSDFALNLYHQMFLYTNDVCNRLTYDMMEQQKEESTLMLIRASSSFVDITRQQQLDADNAQKELLETIAQSNSYIQEQQQQWEKANQQLQMEAVRAQEERERAVDAHKREVEAGKKAALLAMQELIDSNRMHLQEQQQTWEELNAAREKEMVDIDERRKQAEAIIEKQQQDMERMQKILTDTNSQMQPLQRLMKPLTSTYHYVQMFLSGFTALKSMLIAFMSLKALSWIISARHSLYKVFIVGFFAELVVLCLDLANDVDTDKDTSLANGENNVVVAGIQNYIRIAAYIACTLIFLIRQICLQKDATSNMTIDEELKRQSEFEARLRAVHQIDSNTVRTPIQIMHSPIKDHRMAVQQQNTFNREEALEEVYVIKSDPNFKPSERGYSSNFRPYPTPMRECYSPQLASKRSYAAPEPIDRSASAHTVTVTPNNRIYGQQHDSVSTQSQDVDHLQQIQSNQEYSSESSVEMDDSSSDEDEPTEPVMAKKKRKHSELKSSDTELADLPLKRKSKESDPKRKRSKLKAAKIY